MKWVQRLWTWHDYRFCQCDWCFRARSDFIDFIIESKESRLCDKVMFWWMVWMRGMFCTVQIMWPYRQRRLLAQCSQSRPKPLCHVLHQHLWYKLSWVIIDFKYWNSTHWLLLLGTQPSLSFSQYTCAYVSVVELTCSASAISIGGIHLMTQFIFLWCDQQEHQSYLCFR